MVTPPSTPAAAAWRVSAAPSAARSALVFDSPHSWPHWPDGVPAPLAGADALRTSCDAWVDEIWAEAIDGSAPLLAAQFHRAYIDANRARDDIDPALLAGPWPQPLQPSDKSRRGFGLLRRLALPGVPMYDRPLALADVQWRLQHCYDPYHAQLAALVDAVHARHGRVLHIDCHSMKSVGNAMNEDSGQARPDLVVSDLGFRVQVNHPYRGGELIRRHGDPARGRHSVQIEINRALYMDEARFARTAGYGRLVANLKLFVQGLGAA
jgi:N-formylglutamate deformylase